MAARSRALSWRDCSTSVHMIRKAAHDKAMAPTLARLNQNDD